MITKTIVFIGGTWSGHLEKGEVQWWEYWKKHTFAHTFLKNAHARGYSFQWSGELKASRWRWNKPWKDAADRLREHLDLAMIEKPIIVAHSHGGNVALNAIHDGLEVDHLITLATPPRAGVPSPILPSGPIKRWTNIVGTRDWVVRAGMLMDGRVSTATTHKAANNIVLPGETHGSVYSLATWNKHDLWRKVKI
jgi:alpha-beta hydrolase superfamily lysophospholipase